ncbi:hypothetical protein G6514_007751 [Epicoccum nigrum]|nr:hypothetical protein G6514_007751 [Epicoccum nigrum]
MEAAKHFEAYSSVSPHPRSTTSGHILGLIVFSGYIPTIAEVTHNPPRPDIRQTGAPFFAYHPSDDNSHPTLITWGRDLAAYPPSLTFYNLLNTSAAGYWSKQLLPTSFKALNATGTYIPYDGRFRVLYVVGKEDHCVTEKVARNLHLKQQGARFEVEVIGGDHVPMLSRPKEVVGVVRRFAGEKVREEDDDDKGRMEL